MPVRNKLAARTLAIWDFAMVTYVRNESILATFKNKLPKTPNPATQVNNPKLQRWVHLE